MSEKDLSASLLPADPSASVKTEALPITGDDLAVVMRAIRPLDCGALHCRYCRAGSNNQWQHDEHCIYERSVKDAEQARAIVSALRVELASMAAHVSDTLSTLKAMRGE